MDKSSLMFSIKIEGIIESFSVISIKEFFMCDDYTPNYDIEKALTEVMKVIKKTDSKEVILKIDDLIEKKNLKELRFFSFSNEVDMKTWNTEKKDFDINTIPKKNFNKTLKNEILKFYLELQRLHNENMNKIIKELSK